MISAPTISRQARAATGPSSGSTSRSYWPLPWVLVGLAVLVAGVLFVVLTGMHPAYDAYGWLVWGHQALHLNLDTNAAPSWKPLTFLFTLPYALTGGLALWLWMFTAAAGAFAAPIFGGRIAWRLAATAGGRRYAQIVAAAFAGLAVIGLAGYWHFVLIATADPLLVALSLGAIDCHLSGRRRAAWILLVLTSLGRPDAWPIAGLYLIWAWRSEPGMRRLLLGGAVAIPLLWFGIPALTARSWHIASDVALESTASLPGNRVVAVLNGFTSLYELPMQIAVIAGLIVAVVLREWRWLLIAAAGALWLAVEIVLGLRGWAPTPRYMFEPAAVSVVLAGAAAGRLLGLSSRRLLIAWIPAAALVALAVAMAPHARIRLRLLHNGIGLGQTWTRVITRLHNVIARDGGPARILACGQAVTTISFQSILAWETDENVIRVGWVPAKWIAAGQPIVYFKPHHAGWYVVPVHTHGAACARLARSTPSN